VRVQLADCYDRLGNAEEALRLYSEQLTLYRKIQMKKKRWKFNTNCCLYVKQGKLKQAQSAYQEILAIEQKKGNKEES